MGSKALKRAEMAERRAKVVALMRLRMSQTDIARQLGVNQGTVSRDERAIREEWKRQYAAAMNEQIAEDVAVLNDDERRWRQEMVRALMSRMETRTVTRKVKDAGGETTTVDEQVEVVVPPDRDLALKMYDRVLEIVGRRARLMGVEPPVKVAPTDPTGQKEWSGLTDAEYNARLVALVKSLGKGELAALVGGVQGLPPDVPQ